MSSKVLILCLCLFVLFINISFTVGKPHYGNLKEDEEEIWRSLIKKGFDEEFDKNPKWGGSLFKRDYPFQFNPDLGKRSASTNY